MLEHIEAAEDISVWWICAEALAGTSTRRLLSWPREGGQMTPKKPR